MSVTLNELLQRGLARVPTLYPGHIQEISRTVESRVGDLGVIMATESICAACFKGARLEVEILPIRSKLFNEQYALTFPYSAEGDFVGQGICDVRKKNIGLYVPRPKESTQEFAQVLCYQDEDIYASGALKLTVYPDKGFDFIQAHIVLELDIGIPLQITAEDILRKLAKLIVCGKFPERYRESYKENRAPLYSALAGLRLHKRMDEIVRLAESESYDGLLGVCKIIGLSEEEGNLIWKDWHSVLRGEMLINLQYIASSHFFVSFTNDVSHPLWQQTCYKEALHSLSPRIKGFMSGLACHFNYALGRSLVLQTIQMCEPFRCNRSFWRDLANKVVIATMIRKSEKSAFGLKS